MKIVTTAESFVAALKDSRVAKKDTIPVLRFVKLSGNTLTATDLDITTIRTFDSKGKGECLIPYKQAFEILKGESGALEISVEEPKKSKKPVNPKDDAEPIVKLSVNGCVYSLKGSNIANFPQSPDASEPTLTIPSKEFKTMLDRVLFAISHEESRYTLNGALIEATEDVVKLVGTDGHRLSLTQTHAGEGSLSRATLIPTAALDYLKTRLDESISIGIGEDPLVTNVITIRTGNLTLITRKLSGQFPNYEAVMPNKPPITIKVSDDIAPMVTRVAKCADERSMAVKLSFGSRSTISASSIDRGAATAPLPFSSSSEMVIGASAEYLLDFLKSVKGIAYNICLKDNQSPMMFTATDYVHVLMPMRI